MAKTAPKDTTPPAASPAAAPVKQKSGIFGMLDAIGKAKTEDGSIRVPLADIAPDPNQPRRTFDEEKLGNLAESIKIFGVIQPLAVRRSGTVPPYYIVAGERRWRAAGIAAQVDVPVFVRDDLADDDEKRGVVQLVENTNREDLSDYEIACKIQSLIDASPDPSRYGLKAEVARSLNMKPESISRLLAMLNADNRELVEAGLIVSADALARFRAAPEDLQAQMVAQAKESGEPITAVVIRAAKAAAAKSAADTAPPAAAADTAPSTPPAAVEAGEGASQLQDGGTAPAALAGEAGDASATAGDNLAGQLSGSDDDVAPFGGSSSLAGGGGEDEDDNADAAAGAGHSFGGSAGGEGGGSSSNAGGSGTPRAKAVSVATTGEGIEVLLRYLVDKSSDRLEVRMPADLAIAVIEKLKGEVPEDPNAYGQRIKDLLTDKLSG